MAIQTITVVAPTGGVNTIAPPSGMPATDCVSAENLIPAEYGLRVRLGYREHVTGMTGNSDTVVRTVVPFVGSKADGSTNKIFAMTETGIWDCTVSSGTPSQITAFSVDSGRAGYGTFLIYSLPDGDRILLYCDEENGLFAWREGGSSFSLVPSGTRLPWQTITIYSVGMKVVNGSKVYTCTTGGVSAGSGGPTGTGTGIADGSVVWDYVGAEDTTAIGPNYSAQSLGLTLDCTKLVQVCAWKSRLFFVEKDTTRAWYLDTSIVAGVATAFDFGIKMRTGGYLVGLYNFSYDAGAGMDTQLVGLSSNGDIVQYSGSDPNSADTFTIAGVWSCGALPSGRRVATEFGGDLLILSLTGLVALSQLVVNGQRAVYLTEKIANGFSTTASAVKDVPGWSVFIHPTDNALVITIPTNAVSPTNQLAYSLSTKGWFYYRNLPLTSAAVMNGVVYFGTSDGRLCINDGYVDNVSRTDPTVFSAIQFALVSSFTDLGKPNRKRIREFIVNLLTQSANVPLNIEARYDFNIYPPAPPTGAAASNAAAAWDSATWDQSVWQADYSAVQQRYGAGGEGRKMGYAISGYAAARTVFSAIDVFFEVGGFA